MNFGARRYYIDNYAMRLAETYLLRAEAFIGLGKIQRATEDINIVRERSNAEPVMPGDVNIEYKLVERIRELFIAEPRRITLARLNMVYNRTVRYNKFPAPYIKPFNNLYPIPFHLMKSMETL